MASRDRAERRGHEGEEEMCSEDVKEKPSWIFKIIIPIEQVRDHLHHGLEEAIFIARLSAKDAKLMRLHCICPLLLTLKSDLPREICLVPVVCGDICDVRKRWLEC